jgi:hypothetical protein
MRTKVPHSWNDEDQSRGDGGIPAHRSATSRATPAGTGRVQNANVSTHADKIEERICTRCQASVRPVSIAYGFPSVEMMEAAERGEIRLGGCVIQEEDPPFACPACGEPLPPIG